MIYIIIFRVALACSFVVSKALLEFVPPFFLAGLRMTLGGTLCLAYVYFFKPKEFYIKKKNVLSIIGIVIFSGYLTNGLEAWGLSQTIAAKAYFIYNFSPFIAALLGFLFFHEKMSRNKWFGLLIGFFGFLSLIYSDLQSDNIFISTLPELAILAAAASMVLGIVAKKKLMVFQHYYIVMANGLLLFFGGLMSLGTGFQTETIAWRQIVSTPALYWLLPLNITLTCLIAYNMYGILVKRYSITFISFSEFLGIFLVAFLGWAFLGEEITGAFWIAFILVAIGMYVFYREELRHRKLRSLFDEGKLLK